jgi:hypothetical protein
MDRKIFTTTFYVIVGVCTYVIDFMPLNIGCLVLLLFSGYKILFEIFEDENNNDKKGFYNLKLIICLALILLITIVIWTFMYKHKLL